MRLHLLWLACAAAGFTVTAVVGCVLAVASSVAALVP